MCGWDPAAPVVAEWDLLLPLHLPSPNLRVVNQGSSRWQYAKIRDDCRTALSIERRRHKVSPATGRRAVLITRYFGGRERLMDRVNWSSACKPLLDAMVLEKLLLDDSIEMVSDFYRQVRHAQLRGVGVRIQEVG